MRSLRALALVSLSLVVLAPAAQAAETLVEKGQRGTVSVVDTDAQPGGSCAYDVDGSNDLDLIEARSPKAFARDRSSSRDSQWVGMRLVFQKSKLDGGNGGWETVYKTPMTKKLAYDDKAVKIGTLGWQASYTGTPHFRALAAVRWYKPGTKNRIQGATTLRYQWYDTGAASSEMDRCLPEP